MEGIETLTQQLQDNVITLPEYHKQLINYREMLSGVFDNLTARHLQLSEGLEQTEKMLMQSDETERKFLIVNEARKLSLQEQPGAAEGQNDESADKESEELLGNLRESRSRTIALKANYEEGIRSIVSSSLLLLSFPFFHYFLICLFILFPLTVVSSLRNKCYPSRAVLSPL